MTLIDRTERQTSEDVVVQGGGWIIKAFSVGACVIRCGCLGAVRPCIYFTLVIQLAATPFADRGIRFTVCAQGLMHLIVPICAKDVICLAVSLNFSSLSLNAK